jgi:microsomal dipeptidase-like Zn-dependent dipeptidase
LGLHALVAGAVVWGAHCGSAGEPIDPLWGFADLHAHPAFHLAYGAALNADGTRAQAGIMWGLPGGKLTDANDATIAKDLEACDADTHGKANIIANVLLTQLAAVLGTPHGKNGYPTFENWPLATAGLHQQMHVTWLRRAYDGGQRLLVASVVENATLAAAFLGNFNSPGAKAIHDAERVVADAQIAFIKQLVKDNSDWLALATTSADAITEIGTNHQMAIVLGTEFDTLDEQEMKDLYGEGVRVFIPIHLADSDAGGTAVYEDAFNVHNAYMRGTGYTIQHDDLLTFALSLDIPPLTLLGLPLPNPKVDTNIGVPPGHRNVQGLTPGLGHDLIQAIVDIGAVIDVAHMGQQSIKDTLDIVEPQEVPIMDSHTGVRPPSERAYSERDLRFIDATRIGKLGGMIGLGTGGITADMTTTSKRTFYSSPFHTIDTVTHSYMDQVPQAAPPVLCKGLSLTVTTADDDIREGSFARAKVTNFKTLKDPQSNPVEINQGFHLDNHQSITMMIHVDEGTLASQLDVELEHETHDDGFETDDKWNLGGVTLTCGPAAFSANGAVTLKDDDSAKIDVKSTDATMVTSVPIDVWTGDQKLDSGKQVDVEVLTKSGVTTTCPDVAHDGLASKTVSHLTCALPSPIAMSDIASVSLHKKSSGSWDITMWTAGLDDGTPPPVTFVDTTYDPPLEIKKVPLLLAPHTLPQHMVRITIVTDTAGLQEGIDATATFQFSDSSPDQTTHLNHGARLFGGQVDAGLTVKIPLSSKFQFYAMLDGDHVSSDIQSFRIDAPGTTSDWPITQVVLEAFEEPVERWVTDLADATRALNRADDGCFSHDGFCGVALGTDLNGMAPAIPGTTISPYDTTTQPGQTLLMYPQELGGQGTITQLSTTGSKTWDIRKDGIAHVGLLPDFLVAAANATQPNAARTVSTVFHSAGDFVRMWSKIEKKKK